MPKFEATVEIGMSLSIPVNAENMEKAVEAARAWVKETNPQHFKGGYDLLDWEVQLRGIYDDKSMLNQ